MHGHSNITLLRGATTLMETIVSIGVLGTAIALVGNFAVQMNKGLKVRELQCRIAWELTNTREQIGNWPIERITPSNIEELATTESLAKLISDAKWTATVINGQENGLGPDCRQVTLALMGNLDGQRIAPATLTFWVFPKKEPTQ